MKYYFNFNFICSASEAQTIIFRYTQYVVYFEKQFKYKRKVSKCVSHVRATAEGRYLHKAIGLIEELVITQVNNFLITN